MYDYCEFKSLVGKTMASIEVKKHSLYDGDKIVFTTTENEVFEMYHNQDCCEYVHIEDICGDLEKLIGSPILLAEESSNSSGDTKDGSETWTFYKIATFSQYVTIRWYGSSNGYYSEGVSFYRMQ